VTLAPKGLLIEESRTNLLLQSEDFSTTWTVSGANATITTNTEVSPNATQTADTLTDNATNGIHRVAQATSALSAATKYSVSVYAKYSTLRWITLSLSTGTSTWAGAKFDIQDGVLGSLSQEGSGWSADSSSITPVGNGWYRCVVVVTCGTAATGVFAVSCATDGTTFTSGQRGSEVYSGTGSFVFLWGAQLESGSFSTSYIPTTTAAATRAADVAVMTGANFSNWYNQSEGSFYVDADMFDTQFGFFRYLLAANDASGSGANIVGLSVPSNVSSLRFIVNSAGVTSAALTATLTLGAPVKVAGAYKVDDFAVSYNGGTPLTDTSGDAPSGINTLVFGNTSHTVGVGANSSTHIRRIAYFPRRLSNAELQGITA
jgi:hypothetical protein